MEQVRMKRLEDELRRLIAIQEEAQEEERQTPIPGGTRAIRRRKGAPDKHIK